MVKENVINLFKCDQFSSVQFSSVPQSCPTLCDPMNRSMPGLPVHHPLPEFTQTHIHRGSDAIQPSYPLSSPSPPALNPSQHQSLSNESTLRMRWPKYWSFSFSISPSNKNPGLFSFRMDWLDLLAVQGTRKSFLQHHSSKASILQRSAFSTVQLSHPYMTAGKTIALTSCVQLFMTPWNAASQASVSFTISQSLLKLMFIESVDAIQPFHPLLSPSPPALNPSQHQSLFQ